MTDQRRGRASWLWLLAVAGLVAIVVLGGRSSEPSAFDPRSSDPTGTKALVVLLGELGADVTITSEVPRIRPGVEPAPVLAVLRDDAALSDEQLTAVDEALARGATVVVTDPSSPLTPPVAGPLGELGPFATEAVVDAGDCTVDAVAGIGSIRAFDAYAFEVQPESESCFGFEEGAFVVASERDGGNLVAVGGTTPFTNQYLGDADNAALAAGLLAARPDTEVVFLVDDPLGATAAIDAVDSPFDLVDSSVVGAMVQLGLAFLVYALWRSRRLGRPLREPQPVDIAGSELVAAVGDLLQRTRDPQRAARLLRADTRRRLCRLLGLPGESPPETVAAAVTARTAVPADRITRALSTQPVSNDDELVSLAREIESLLQEILHDHTR